MRQRTVHIEAVGGLVTVKEAARLLGISVAAMKQRVQRDTALIVYRVGHERLVSLQDIRYARTH